MQINKSKKSPSRIAFIFPAAILGGHELMAINIIEKLVESGDMVDCYVPDKNIRLKDFLLSKKLNVKQHAVNHKRFEIIHAFLNFSFRRKAVKFLSNKITGNYDEVVLAQGDIELGSVFLNMASSLGINVTSYIPYTHSFRLMGKRLWFIRDWLAKFVYRSCSKYVTISNCFAKQLKLYSPNASVEVVQNFVETPTLPPTQLKRRAGDPIRLYLIGRVSFQQKGHDLLIQALTRLKSRSSIPVIEMHFIGDGPDLEQLKSIVSVLPAAITPVVHGWVNDCWSIAYNADLLLIPSRFEGVPLIMLEAMSREIKILASDRDGMGDYLSEDSLYHCINDTDAVEGLFSKLSLFIDSFEENKVAK